MKLLVDIGNSQVKWLSHTGQTRDHMEVFPASDLGPEQLDVQWGKLAVPGEVLVSNVAGNEPAKLVEKWCRDYWQITPDFARVNRSCAGVTCAYKDLAQLGVDRWLAIVAGWHRYQEACIVVDCGTATTIDAVSADGQHLGGLILPGIHIMQDLLVRNTTGIRSTLGRKEILLADNTGDAVSNGCLLATVSCIEHVLQALKAQGPDDYRLMITGGAAGVLRSSLHPEFEHVETLVLDGLLIAENTP